MEPIPKSFDGIKYTIYDIANSLRRKKKVVIERKEECYDYHASKAQNFIAAR